MQSEHLQHTIDPVFDARSRVLMLGSFPSPKSREVGFFYGHPQNRMWRVLTAVTGESAVPRTTEERTAFLLRNRIAMWDVIASCTIEGASDASIRNVVPNDLSRILDVAPIEENHTSSIVATKNPRPASLRSSSPRRAPPTHHGASSAWWGRTGLSRKRSNRTEL